VLRAKLLTYDIFLIEGLTKHEIKNTVDIMSVI